MTKMSTGTAPEDIFAGPDSEDTTDLIEELDFSEPTVRETPSDPTMDPASPRWNPRKYFGAQSKEIIVILRTESDILSDPRGQTRQEVPVSINGYTLMIAKGVPTKVPKDFASHLINIGAAYSYSNIPEAIG